ncbi:hypothetical protein BDW72DRAFT_200895 [Aspergillus terricola var. indicus]
MSSVRTQPPAEVVWWTDTQLCVRCPYCEELHRHGLSFSSGASTFVSRDHPRTSRVPHCAFATRPPYNCTFPADYEIGKPKARFEESDDEASLLSLLSNLASLDTKKEVSFDYSTEKITIQSEDQEPFTQRRILHAIADCCRGHVGQVKNYLETTPDKSIFLQGKDAKGDTCLIKASREQTPAMVSLLLGNGAEVNASNQNGRTALMEAALWGRLETMEILLSRGADRTVRDSKKKKAVDLALPTRQNRKERHAAVGGTLGDFPQELFYYEDVVNRDADRRETARILEGGQSGSGAGHHPKMSSDDLSIAYYAMPRSRKAVAVLERGGHFPPKVSMSGWSHDEGKYSTGRVMKLSELVGHILVVDDHYDHDKTPNPQFYEKIERLEREINDMRKEKKELDLQLFDNDDCLLGDEYDKELVKQLKEKVANIDRSLSLSKCKDKWKMHERLNRISEKAPTNTLERATILITAPSYKICDNCREFNCRVNEVLGLSIQLYECTRTT